MPGEHDEKGGIRRWWGAVCRWCSLQGKAGKQPALACPGPMMLGYASIMMLTAFK